MVADQRFGVLEPGRMLLGEASLPFYWLTGVPRRLGDWLRDSGAEPEDLHEQNRALRAENLMLQARSSRLAALTAENVRLRELLNSTALLEENVLVAEIVGISPDPGSQIAVVDKGESAGVRVGQAVIDARGLFGQVVETTARSARVLLITDAMHAVPAQVVRNGVRVIAEGTGRIDSLNINYVAATMDLRPGDLLVSSGLGQRFPRGYPVATVISVVNDPGRPFEVVTARPSAELDRARHVLVITRDESAPEALAEVAP